MKKRRVSRRFETAALTVLAMAWAAPCLAQQSSVQFKGYEGMPAQIVPKYFETGYGHGPLHPSQTSATQSAPSDASTGTATSNASPGAASATSANGAGDGTTASGTTSDTTSAPTDASATSTSGSSASSASSSASGSTALNTMMATSWGAQAAQNAQALGVNPSAVAATCVVESGCQNVSGTGSITGAFQMTASTYQSSFAAATQENPNLAQNAVSGLAGQNDPATQSIAAAEYLKQGAQYLQQNGDSNPTVTDVRAYYNFGPAGGKAVANADPSEAMQDVLPMYTSSQLSANGITAGETVAQWKAGVAAKIGNAASQNVLM